MYCNNCGRELKDGETCDCRSEVRQNDEAPIDQQTQQQYQPPFQPPEQPPYQQQYQQPQYQQPAYINNAPASPVIDIMRRHGSSPMMLSLVILIAVGLVVSAVAMLFTNNFDAAYYYDVQSELQSALAASSGLMTMLSLIPGIIVLIGVLLFYMDCKNPKTPFVAKRGLTTVQVMAIITVSLLGAAMVIIGLSLIVAGPLSFSLTDYYAGYDIAALTGMVVTIVGMIFIIVIAVAALYYISFLKTLSALKHNAVTGTPIKRVSMLFIVMLYIMGGFSFIGALGSFGAPLSALSSLISASTLIIGGVILQRYRTEINRFMMMAHAPY